MPISYRHRHRAFSIIAQRRRVAVSLLAHVWGVLLGTEGQRYYVVDIVNAGAELAILKAVQIVHGSIVPNPEFPVEYSLNGGGRTRIWIESAERERVWFRFEWVTPRDRRFEYAGWRPLINGDQTEAGQAWVASNLRSGKRPRLRLYRDWRPRRVDPEHAANERMRVTWGKS